MRSCCSKVLAAALACASAVTAAPPTARADHSEDERIIDQTAYTLPAGRFQLGLLRQEWGPLDRLTVGTYALPWILRAPNAHAKVRVLGSDPLSLAASAGVFHLSTDALGLDTTAIVTILPFEVVASWRIDDRWTLSPGFAYTFVTLKGSYDPEELEGVAAVSNLQTTATLEHRFTRVTAFVVHVRYLVFQHANGRATATIYPDAFTTVDAQAVASTDDLNFPFAASIVPSVVFSEGIFNLRLGVGYGNFSIPGINLVLPNKTVIPDLDLYFRF